MNEEFKFYAVDPQNGRLLNFGESLNEFIATLYLQIYNSNKDWAKENSKTSRFYIDFRHFHQDGQYIPCICISSGVFDLPLAKIYGAHIIDVQAAFRIRRETLEKLKNQNDNLGYAA